MFERLNHSSSSEDIIYRGEENALRCIPLHLRDRIAYADGCGRGVVHPARIVVSSNNTVRNRRRDEARSRLTKRTSASAGW